MLCRGGAPAGTTSGQADARWVKCRRPVVITGGELTLDMLDLQFERSTRFYSAPPQLKASNGVLIIDDLGRQKITPQELMNRWIVPLDRRIDYLALHTGEKVMVPFDVTVVFCTNIAPSELAALTQAATEAGRRGADEVLAQSGAGEGRDR